MLPNHEQKSHQKGLIKIDLVFATLTDGALHRRAVCSSAALRSGQEDPSLSEGASHTTPLSFLEQLYN